MGGRGSGFSCLSHPSCPCLGCPITSREITDSALRHLGGTGQPRLFLEGWRQICPESWALLSQKNEEASREQTKRGGLSPRPFAKVGWTCLFPRGQYPGLLCANSLNFHLLLLPSGKSGTDVLQGLRERMCCVQSFGLSFGYFSGSGKLLSPGT